MKDLEQILKIPSLLEELTRSIHKILLARFSRLSPAEREDIEQEVKLKLCRTLARGKKIAHLRSYLWRVVLTTSLDVLEARENLLPLEDVPSEYFGEGGKEARQGERRFWLAEAIKVLSPDRRAVVSMYLQGKNLGAIARELSWGENRVRHLLYRGLNDLKKRLSSRGAAAAGEVVMNGPGE